MKLMQSLNLCSIDGSELPCRCRLGVGGGVEESKENGRKRDPKPPWKLTDKCNTHCPEDRMMSSERWQGPSLECFMSYHVHGFVFYFKSEGVPWKNL